MTETGDLLLMFFNEHVFEITHCLNATIIYQAEQKGIKARTLGFTKEVIAEAHARLITLGMIECQEVEQEFEEFWVAYGRVGVKKKALSAFKKLTKQDRKLAMASVKAYVESTPNKKYRKHAQGYLNDRMFDPENYTPATVSTKNEKAEKSIFFDKKDSRLMTLLCTLQSQGYVEDYKHNHLVTEKQVRDFYERECYFRIGLADMISYKFCCPFNDPRLEQGGEFEQEFLREKEKLIQIYFR